MNKNKQKQAFSLAEAIILIIILAVVIIASTPFLTKKLQNVSDAGSTLGGGAHGRYEIFYQEFLGDCTNEKDCLDRAYRKIYDNEAYKKEDAGKNKSVIVYQKLNDKQYKDSYQGDPNTPQWHPSSGGDPAVKDTIYVELGRGEPIKNPDGAVIGATIYEYNALGQVIKKTQYPDTTSGAELPEYVFENAYVTYKGNGFKYKEDRIIEGHHTKLCKKGTCRSVASVKENNDNNYFIVNDKDNTKFNLEYHSFPWKRKYVGTSDKPSEDAYLELNADNTIKNPLNIPTDTKNIVFHAVGGGGFGGNLEGAISPAIIPTSKTGSNKTIIENRLIAAYQKALNTTNKPAIKFLDNTDESFNKQGVLKVLNINSYPAKYFEDGFTFVVNTKYHTISGKIDFRENHISTYPHKILQYTHVLGTPTQKAVVYDMPKWFDTNYINGSGFRLGGAICGPIGETGSPSECSISGIQCDWMPKCTPVCTPGTSSDCTCGPKNCKDSCGNSCSGCAVDIKNSIFWNPKTSKVDVDLLINKASTLSDNDLLRIAKAVNFVPGESATMPTSSVVSSKSSGKSSGGNSGGSGDNTPSCSGCSDTATHTCKHKVTMSCTKTDYYDCPDAPGESCSEITCPECTFNSGYNPIHKSCKGGIGGNGSCGWVSVYYSDLSKIDQIGTDLYAGSAKLTVHRGGRGGDCATYGAACTLGAISPGAGRADCRQAAADGNARYSIRYGGTLAGGAATKQGLHDHNNKPGGYCDCNNLPSQGAPGKNNDQVDCSYGSRQCSGVSDTVPALDKNGQTVTVSLVKYGSGSPSPTNADTLGFGGSGNIYNYFYVWTIPYGINALSYGEAGEAGEYASAKVNSVDDRINIKLGKAGGRAKPDGTSTVVKIGDKKILEAKGGKGGDGDKKTDMFDMCFNLNQSETYFPKTPDGQKLLAANKICKAGDKKVSCCMGNIGVKNTKNISSTYIKQSKFEDIAAYTNKSPIVGIGLGRGGQGAASTTFDDEVIGMRSAVNASTATSYKEDNKVISRNTSPSSVLSQYANRILKISDLNSNGGGGAVIIMW